VQTIDVLPTAADALDLPAPAGIDGRSALAPRFKPSGVAELWSTTSVGKSFGRRTYPMSLVRRRFAQVIAQQAAQFGTGPLGPKFFDLAPAASLVGRAARALPPGSRKLKVRLNGKPTGSPAVVSGSVEGVAPKRGVAVVIGGKVAATAQTYRYTTDVRFETAVPKGGPVSVYALG
jgi:hypothetical protein